MTEDDQSRLDVLVADPLYQADPPVGTVEVLMERPARQVTTNQFTRAQAWKEVSMDTDEARGVFAHYVDEAASSGWEITRVSCFDGGALIATAVKEFGDWSAIAKIRSDPPDGSASLRISAQAAEREPGETAETSALGSAFDLDTTCFQDPATATP